MSRTLRTYKQKEGAPSASGDVFPSNVNFSIAAFGLGATAHMAGDFGFGELLGSGFGELDVLG